MKKFILIFLISLATQFCYSQSNTEILSFLRDKFESHTDFENITFNIKGCNLIIVYDQFKKDPSHPLVDVEIITYTIPITEIDLDASKWQFDQRERKSYLGCEIRMKRNKKTFKREFRSYETGKTTTEYVNKWPLNYEYSSDISQKLNSYFKKLNSNCIKG